MSRDRPHSEYQDDRDADRAPYDDTYAEETAYDDDDRTFTGFLPFGWPATFSRGTTDERYPEDYDDEYTDDYARQREYEHEDDEGTWLDEGAITLTILAGVALFLFPEPTTSGLGVMLIAIGILAWFLDWAAT